MNTTYFLIGASGAGKTTALKEIENKNLPKVKTFYFDSIGVPSLEDMTKEYGTSEEWQRAKTKEWVKRLKQVDEEIIVLDGQTRPVFIDQACKEEGTSNYKIILLDCSDEVRRERLISRGHPELASQAMMHWAQYLREACTGSVCSVIDNSNLSMAESVSTLLKVIGKE